MDSRSRSPVLRLRPRLRPIAAATLVAFFASLAPSIASAQPAPPAPQSAQDRASARVQAEDADRKMTSGDYAGAIDSFTRAYAFIPAPTIKVARAHAYLKLGRLIEAQQDLLDAARSDPQPGEPISWGEARHRALGEADAITPRLPLLLLGVTGAPVDRVTLTVDGQPVAIATLGSPRAVNPGAHSLKAEADGYVSTERAVTLAEGEHKTVTFALTVAPGAVSVPGPPTAEVQPPAPPSSTEPPPPPPVYTPVPAWPPPPDQTTPRPPPQETPSNLASTLGWVGTGVFGGAGLLTGLIAITEASYVKSQCTNNVCPTSVQSEASTSSTLGNFSTVTFVLAGGCLLLGILTHHSAPSRTAMRPATQPSVDLLVGPGSVGAVGRF